MKMLTAPPSAGAPRDYRRIALTICTAVALLGAVAVPRFLLAGDPWLDASRFIRAQARPGDLVILPVDRVERLPAFRPAWSIAADAIPTAALTPFRRVFTIDEGDTAPPAGLTIVSSRRFGHLSVRECAPR